MISSQDDKTKLCCVLVGLPARGKTFISRKIARYLNWLDIRCQVFNVGQYRRRICGVELPHSFFDPTNLAAERQRTAAAMACLEDMLAWLAADRAHQVAVYDATNSTRERRQMITRRCAEFSKANDVCVRVLLIESICSDPRVVVDNVRQIKRNSPDYASMRDDAEVVADFMARIEHYARAYHPVADDEGAPIIRLIDLGRRYEVVGVGPGPGRPCWWAETRLAHLLINVQPRPRSIYVCRHGESEFNRQGRIGGDADLSNDGWRFARHLPAFFVARQLFVQVWTSSFKRTKQTASLFSSDTERIEWKALDEIDAGTCEGLTYEEIAARFPQDLADRDLDKFRYRYRGGESYADLINRMEPIIIELERGGNDEMASTLIVAHQAVLRTIIGYFAESPLNDIPYIKVPLHTVIELIPQAYGCTLKEHPVGIPAVNTHRPRPS